MIHPTDVLVEGQCKPVESTPIPPIPESFFPKVRGYEILSVVGYGGMGIVFEARHKELNRRVAIKTLRGEALLGPEFRERFRAEAEAIAKLQHPNIIQVFEVGTLEQQPNEPHPYPFIALEFVDGGSLTDRTHAPQPPRYAARTVETLARAAHSVHVLGIVHRDLKPANVLLTCEGVPKIADFGIAKQYSAKQSGAFRQLTRAGSVMGTPEYMAPEQFADVKATPAIDVYALGVILYELLTGRVPFQGASFADTMLLTTGQDPVPPRRLQPGIPRDLEVICLKCLEKSPPSRYESAEALADDLARWAEGKTIQARPIGLPERMLRWARRNPSIAALSVLVLLVALAGLAGITWKWNDAEKNAAIADQEAKKAEREAKNALEAAKKERWERYRVSVVAASSELRLEDSNSAKRALNAAPEEYRDWLWRLLYAQLDKSQFVLSGKEGLTHVNSISPDGRWVLLADGNQSVRVWDSLHRKEYNPVPDESRRTIINCATLSADGSRLAYESEEHIICVHDVQSGQLRARLKGHTKKVNQMAFFRDAAHLISTSHDGTFRVWDVNSGESSRIIAHNTPGLTFELCPDERSLLIAKGRNSTATLIDLENGRELASFPGHVAHVHFTQFSPSGRRLATVDAYPSNIIHLWDVPSGKHLAALKGHSNQINDVRFSLDEKRIASCSMDRTVRVWDIAPEGENVEPMPVAIMKGHTGWVYKCDFSPDGTRIVSASQDTTLRYWDVKSGDQLAILRGHTADVLLVGFARDGSRIVSGDTDRAVRVWEIAQVERDQAIKGHENFAYSVAFHPDGKRIASSSWDGTARLWDATTGKQLKLFDHGETKIVPSVAIHPKGHILATIARDNGLRLWDIDSGKLLHRFEVPSIDWRDSRISFSPDGEFIASGSPIGRVFVWNVNTRTEHAVLENHKNAVRDVAFSPDGRWLASAGDYDDLMVRIWDVARKTQVEALKGHEHPIYTLAWNRSGTLLASASIDGIVRIWDTKTWQEVGNLNQGAKVYGMSFTPDGKLLAFACSDNVIRLWDVETRQEIAELSGHTDYVHSLAFSPDGTRLASASGDRTIRVWDALSAPERAKK